MSDRGIVEWLDSIGLPQYVELFLRNEIGMDVLPDLAEPDLEHLGIPLGSRKRLLKAIQALSRQGAYDRLTQDASRASSVDAERRQLTVLFCDLVGSTALAHEIDPEQLRELMRAYQQACGKIIDKYEGHVAQYLGDGLMVYFGWPRAHEDDAERAVRASLDIIAAIKRVTAPAPLQVRIGIATGPVVVGETGAGDASVPKLAVGETPNLAARLQGLAGADQIVVAPNTYRLVGSAFEYQDLGDHTLKGILDPMHAWRVFRESPIEGRFEATRGAVGLTPLVGREEEIALMLRRWQGVKSGDGQIVLLCGEPGIGKSRIMRTLRDRIGGEPHVRLRYQCSPFHTQSALYPVIEQLQRAAGFTRDDSLDQKLDKLEGLLAQALPMDRLPAVAPLFATLLSLPADRYTALNVSPQKQKERTFDALGEQVAGLSKHRPLLMVVEDAHWIDPSTQESLSALVARIAHLPALLLITYRPEYSPPWVGEPHVTTLTLNRLSHKLAAQLAIKVTGGKALPKEVLEQIVVKTDGVPLFVEELTKTVLESGLLEERGDSYELSGPLPSLAIPSTLHDSLMARLDRLAPIKETAHIGACIGRNFTHELMAAISPLAEPRLTQALDQLVQSQLIFQQGAAPAATYTFKHALIRDAAYQSLLKSKRHQYHAKIAQALVERFSDIAETQPEVAAHHFEQSSQHEAAIGYLQKASHLAMRRSAPQEAITYLRQGLGLVELVPPTAAQRHELDLRLALGFAIVPAMGWGSSQAAEAFERALALADRGNQHFKQFSALYGLSLVYTVQAKHRRALGFAQQAVQLAERLNESGLLVHAHMAAGWALMWMGDFAGALRHYERTVALYDPAQHASHTTIYGYDAKSAALGWLAHLLYLLGYSEQARARLREAQDWAERLAHPHSKVIAADSSFWLLSDLREWESLAQVSAKQADLCREQGFEFFVSTAKNRQGEALIELDRPAEGIELVSSFEAEIIAMSCGNFLPRSHSILALGLAKLGQLEPAMKKLSEAIDRIENTEERSWEAYVHHAHARVWLLHDPPQERKAETSFLRALDVARRQQAKGLELRAALGLAQLWQRNGKRRQARDLLAEIYDWFTEGFDTKDLQEAKALLGELGQTA